MPPHLRRPEGPFGDHTGFYSLADQFPVFHVTALTHRANPAYPTTIVGKPPQEDCYMGKATERIFLPLMKMFIPEIVEGKRLFLKAGCYACHGHEAEGAVGPDLTDDEWIYKPTDAMIFNTIAKGRRGTVMAPFGDQLTPDEIWKIVEFLRDKNRQRHLKEQ